MTVKFKVGDVVTISYSKQQRPWRISEARTIVSLNQYLLQSVGAVQYELGWMPEGDLVLVKSQHVDYWR